MYSIRNELGKSDPPPLQKMSIRSEAKDLSAAMQQTLAIDPAIMQSAAAAAGPGPLMAPAGPMMATSAADNEAHLHEANSFNTNNPEHPLKRTVVVNIRASLNELCLRKQKATWAPPSSDAVKAVFQQALSSPCPGPARPPLPPLSIQVLPFSTPHALYTLVPCPHPQGLQRWPRLSHPSSAPKFTRVHCPVTATVRSRGRRSSPTCRARVRARVT